MINDVDDRNFNTCFEWSALEVLKYTAETCGGPTQVDKKLDPFSHLAVQLWSSVLSRKQFYKYRIYTELTFTLHLQNTPTGNLHKI